MNAAFQRVLVPHVVRAASFCHFHPPIAEKLMYNASPQSANRRVPVLPNLTDDFPDNAAGEFPALPAAAPTPVAPSVHVRRLPDASDLMRAACSPARVSGPADATIDGTEPSMTNLSLDNLFEIGFCLGHAGKASDRELSTAFSRMAGFALINSACSVAARRVKYSPAWAHEAARLCDRQIKAAVKRKFDPETRRNEIMKIAGRFPTLRLETRYDTSAQTKTAIVDGFRDITGAVLKTPSWKRFELSLRHIGEPIRAGLREFLAQLAAMNDSDLQDRQFFFDLQDNQLGAWLVKFCEFVLQNGSPAQPGAAVPGPIDSSPVDPPAVRSSEPPSIPKPANARSCCFNLVSLNLGGNALMDESAIEIARLLKGNRSLRELDLGRNFHNNFITGTGAKALFDALAQQGYLEKFIFEGNKCLDQAEALASLAHLLKTTTTLKCLDLGSTGLTIAGMAILAPALAQNSTLQTLNISGNKLGAAGLDILIDVFLDEACKSVIENLQCSALDIDEDGLTNLSQWLSSNPTLRELGLGINRFSNNKALCLLQALATNFQLSYLNLQYAHFDEQGLIVLLEVMQARTTPLRLTLGYHKVSWSRDEDALAQLKSEGLAISWDFNN